MARKGNNIENIIFMTKDKKVWHIIKISLGRTLTLCTKTYDFHL